MNNKKRIIDNEIFVCLDCETTGLDPDKDRIIEIAAAVFDAKNIYEQKSWLIDPECSIPQTSIEIHGITDEMVRGQPKIAEVLPLILPLLDKGPIVGHGVRFDMLMVANAAKRAQIPCNLLSKPYLDTLRMSRRYGETTVYSLNQMREHFRIEYEGAHRALNDVIVNIDVFRNLSKDYLSTAQLLKILSKPVLMKRFPFGKYKDRLLVDVPLPFLRWTRKLDLDQDLNFSIEQEIRRRAKGNTFQQANNPFKDL